MRSLKTTIRSRPLDILRIQTEVIFPSNCRRMQFLYIRSLDIAISTVHFLQIIIIISPVVIWSQWVCMSARLEYTVLVYIFNLQS